MGGKDHAALAEEDGQATELTMLKYAHDRATRHTTGSACLTAGRYHRAARIRPELRPLR